MLKFNFEGILFVCLLFGGMLWWLFLLPSWKVGGLRIAFGIVMLFILLPISLLMSRLFQKYPAKIGVIILCIVLCLLQGKNLLNVEDRLLLITNHAILPPSYPIPLTKTVKIGNISVQIPIETLKNGDAQDCWGAKIPCVVRIMNNVEPRGETILQGFRPKKN